MRSPASRRQRLRVSTIPKLSPPSDGATSALRPEQLRGEVFLRQEAEYVDPLVRHALAGEEEPDRERIRADDPQARACSAPDVRPGPKQDLQALAGFLAAGEHDLLLAVMCGLPPAGMSTPLGTTSYSPGSHAAAVSRAWGDTAIRWSSRSARNPQSGVPPFIQPSLPCAWNVPTIGPRQSATAATADRRRHRLMDVQHVEALTRERAPDAGDRSR